MSDVPGNLTYQLKNLFNRLLPVVNRHTRELSDLTQQVKRLEAIVATQQTTIDLTKQDAVIARALAMGTGSSGGDSDGDND